MTRDNHGRFGKGNQAAKGHGRPTRKVEGDYLQAMTEQVCADAWSQIVARAIDDAKNGDHRAREWLSKHLVRPSDNADEPNIIPVEDLLALQERAFRPIGEVEDLAAENCGSAGETPSLDNA